MFKGCFTAIITPFSNSTVDYEGLGKLADFQMENGIAGILAAGTTGESPTLTWDENNQVIKKTAEKTRGKGTCIAGAGSNNTIEALDATKHAADVGAEAVLLVDPYYNGPSSLEIRREYIEPIARAFPYIQVITYVIPGRTGTQILPEDLALLAERFENVKIVKEATGDIENMRRTRECCGKDFSILSGDDALTYQIMTDQKINASGVISVISNIAPKSVSDMVNLLEQGEQAEAKRLASALEPLFNLVTLKTNEETPYGNVVCRARNPLPAKMLMFVLGMPSGGCRKPLGKMTKNGIEKILEIARQVQADSPEIFKPAAEFFNIDVDARLNDPSNWECLYYKEY